MTTNRPLSRKSVRKHYSRLVRGLKAANAAAWETVGRPGPCFSNTDPGPDNDRVLGDHNDLLADEQEYAAQLCREAVASAQAWLRNDEYLMGKAIDAAFTHDGCWVAGPGIPTFNNR